VTTPRLIAVGWTAATVAIAAGFLSLLPYAARLIVGALLATFVVVLFAAWNARIIAKFWRMSQAEWAAKVEANR
jgi:hypothetical protein